MMPPSIVLQARSKPDRKLVSSAPVHHTLLILCRARGAKIERKMVGFAKLISKEMCKLRYIPTCYNES